MDNIRVRSSSQPLNILQVNYLESSGGAARIAWILHKELRKRSHNVWMAVAKRESEDPFVNTIPVEPPGSSFGKILLRLADKTEEIGWRGNWLISGFFRQLSDPQRYWDRFLGKEDFNFPGSRRILELPSTRPDLVHFHNLHRNYFDLRFLPELSQKVPTLITLHDKWLLSGHCAQSIDCDRWKYGCGKCPYLKIYPPVQRDATSYNWSRKKGIYLRSKVYLAAPSKWIVNEINQSILSASAVQIKLIPNGVDTKVFYPKNKLQARKKLSLPIDKDILLFVASDMDKNAYKDYATIHRAIEIVASKLGAREILFLALGSEQNAKQLGNLNIKYIPFQQDLKEVANYFRAADIYLHASKAETFGIVIVEALACGTPVIATAVGGIPEIIVDGKTGFLVTLGDEYEMAKSIILLLEDKNLRLTMGKEASKSASRFNLDRMVNGYIDYYREILHDQQ